MQEEESKTGKVSIRSFVVYCIWLLVIKVEGAKRGKFGKNKMEKFGSLIDCPDISSISPLFSLGSFPCFC